MLSILIFAVFVIGLSLLVRWFVDEPTRVCRKCNLKLSPQEKRCPRCGAKEPDSFNHHY